MLYPLHVQHVGIIGDDGTIYFDQVMHLLSPSTKETVQFVSDECQTKCKKLKNEMTWIEQVLNTIF